jgi:hypothetical protein
MSKSSAVILVCVMALAAPLGVRAEPAVLGLARAYLGPQSTLDGIKSVHYVGTLQRTDDGQAQKVAPSTLDMIFAKPLRQRLVIRGVKVTMTTVLDGYDAWDVFQDNVDPNKHRLKWLAVADVRALRANTWENLYFFSAPESGSVEDKGPATIDGIACERVDFDHGSGTVYQRYFDRDSGRLVLTINGSESIRESGEIMVNGVRFPKAIASTSRDGSGKDLTATATFERISVNDPLEPGLFAVPTFPVAEPAAVPGK